MRKFLLLASLFFILIVSINGVSVSISTSNYRSYSGVLQALYCMNAALRANTTPNPNTTNCQAGITSSSSSIPAGGTRYIYSPRFTSSYTIPGSSAFAIEMWVSCLVCTLTVTAAVVSSTGAVLQSLGSAQSPQFTLNTVTEWHVTLNLGSQVNIPQNSYIRITVTNGQTSSATIYFGNTSNQRPTNFQLPLVVLNT